MKTHIRNYLVFCLIASLLASCAPAPTPSPSPSVTPAPTHTPQTTLASDSSFFEVGRRYSDASEDMAISFLDVVAFRTEVNEETDMLDVFLQMRDIPETADLGQVTNLIEYAWTIHVYLDSTEADSASLPGDYYLSLNTSVDNPSASGNGLTPVPGEPEQVPIHLLFENRNIYNSAGQPAGSVQVDVGPDRNTLQFTGRVPGITSEAVFSFDMSYYDGTADRPDHFVPPQTAPSTPQTSPTVIAGDASSELIPVGNVRVYPGPEHYAGDVLSFAIKPSSNFDESIEVSMALDDQEPRVIPGAFFWFNEVILPSALDTTGLSGHHTVRFITANGNRHETYSFEVLPADRRPANEIRAVWQTKETDCCNFHYLSETAAARDIDFISEHFQRGAHKLESMLKAEIDAKMDIYLLDRMLMNGGFGGNGKLVICYTDRYYGPTVGGAGLETLARHEFSHAADIGLANAGDGVDFNYEGLAVYLAGGHYKPEPLTQRGAALFDLGRAAPVHEFIPQHELSYLHAALILTFIVDTYGEEKLWEFFRADTNTPDGQLLPMADAIPLTFEVALQEFENGFQAWLERNEPGEQLDDLRLTVELQDARREYQDLYSPGPMFLLAEMDISAVTRPEYLSVVMREARAPTNIAVELLIANAQKAIVAGAYEEAEELIQSIKEVVSTGKFEDPLAREYLEIVVTAAEAGYEILVLNIQNSYATAQVTNNPPETTILEIRKIDGVWQVQP